MSWPLCRSGLRPIPAKISLPQREDTAPLLYSGWLDASRNAQHGLPALDVCVLGDADSANLSFISQHAAATKLSTE